MKNCSEIKEFISLYIDDELEPDKRKELEEHIDSCGVCRNELNELMRIIGLCRNIAVVELPGNFRIDLHQKLLEVQGHAEGTVKPVFFRTKYFKLFSSVAAVFLLIFLLKGFFSFDLFPNEKASESSDRIDMMAESPAQDSAQMKAALPDSAGNENSFSSITIAVDDPDSQIEIIKAIVLENSGLKQPSIQLNETETGQTEEGSISLLFDILNTQMSAFIDVLNTEYGQSNVQQGAVIAEDMTMTMEDLLKQSDTLDITIVEVILKKK